MRRRDETVGRTEREHPEDIASVDHQRSGLLDSQATGSNPPAATPRIGVTATRPSTIVLSGDYLGGHADAVGAQYVSLHLGDDGAAIRRTMSIYTTDGWIATYDAPFVRIALFAIDRVDVDGQDQIEARAAAARLPSTGLFAAGFAKHNRRKTTYVTITSPAGDIVFRVNDEAPREVTAKLAPFRGRLHDAQPQSPPTEPTHDLDAALEPGGSPGAHLR
jgi:hypothetical protein